MMNKNLLLAIHVNLILCENKGQNYNYSQIYKEFLKFKLEMIDFIQKYIQNRRK